MNQTTNMSALIFVNKNMEVKYRRVKVGFVFEFNRLISNYCAYDNCNIMVPTFSVKWNLELTAHRLLVFKRKWAMFARPLERCGHSFVRLGYIYKYYWNCTCMLCSIIKIPHTCLTNSTSSSKSMLWFLCVCVVI